MKRVLALSLSLASFTAFSQPTLITEINTGDTWVNTGAVSSDVDMDFRSGNIASSTSSNSDAYGLAALIALEGEGVTPLIDLSFTKEEAEGESVNGYTIAVGGLTEAGEDRKMAFLIGYNGTSDEEENRASFGAQLDVQTSELSNGFHNQLELEVSIMRDNSDTSGGHSLSITNKAKFIASPIVDFVGTLGADITTDMEFDNGAATANVDPSFSVGGQLNIHANKAITISALVLKSFASAEYDYSGTKVSADIDQTIVGVLLMGRF